MRKEQAAVPVADHTTCQDWLDQAEVCREQARIAAGMKRFKAARGLFSTAIALCRQAMARGGEANPEAKDRLRQLDTEMLAYTELSKSMARPLLGRATVPVLRGGTKQPAANVTQRSK